MKDEKLVIHSTEKTFEQDVLKSDIPVIVDFWASWCMPCKMFAPIFEETANQYDGKVKFVKVNVDEERAIAEKYSIMSIPSIYLFNNGKEINTIAGMLPPDRLKDFIDKSLLVGAKK